MELAILVLGLVFSAAAIFAAYHIAGYFGAERVLLTTSQPTPIKDKDPVPPHGREIKLPGLSRSGVFYPFLTKMPLLVTYGIPNNIDTHVVFLLITIINMKKRLINDVSVHVDLPARLTPDDEFEITPPEGIEFERHVDATNDHATVNYHIVRLKPYDCQIIAQPLFIRPNDVIEDADDFDDNNLSKMRFILSAERLIKEEIMYIAAIKACTVNELNITSREIIDYIMATLPEYPKKPLLHRVLAIPAAYRALLWVHPTFFRLDQGVSVHSYLKKGDQTQSGVLGVVLR